MRAVEWWQDAVVYQIYPRSFADGNGDGFGDLSGLIERLDYLEWLGIDAVWLSPITPSPNVDWGYDVSDYTAVDPDFGTLEDLDRLIVEARPRGIRVLLDIVPNHTSDRHPWFRERPGFYVWADRIPNNWRRAFGTGPAWTFDPDRGRFYLHNFAPEQPDLDWWNPAVRKEFERILRFWLDRGVAGFRIDVANALVKDRELRDDVPASPSDPLPVRRGGLRHVHSMNRPETHEVLKGWRAICEAYDPPRVLLGETYVFEPDLLAAYYGSGDDELNLAFDFALTHARLEAAPLRAAVEAIEAHLPVPTALPAWTGSNHDAGRLATRWAGGDERRARLALMMLLTLRGVPVLYMGDELALEDGAVPPERVRDVADPPRDPCRTPFPWTGAGAEWRNPWLPFTPTGRNVADERADQGSTLHFTRELIARRRELAGGYTSLPSPPGVWLYRRGSGHSVALNLSDRQQRITVEGEPLLTVGDPGEPWSGALYGPGA